MSAPVCPICAAPAGEALLSLAFRPKAHLPDQVAFHACRACDLVFSWPRDPQGYARHYVEEANDFLTGGDQFRNDAQLERLSRLIADRKPARVLDFGCGGGGLVTALAARHPDVAFVGHDVNGGFPAEGANLGFSQELPPGPFGLVILSHVLEHATNPGGMIATIRAKLRPDCLYIEVPDAEGYRLTDQPQYLYYVDRLHLNHFGLRALTRAVGPGHRLVDYGRYEMPYALGPLYPCQYGVFAALDLGPGEVETAFGAYAAGQLQAAQAARRQVGGRMFYIYGYGDNLFRNRSEGGPMAGMDEQVMGVIDRNIEALRNHLPDGWQAVHPDDLAGLNGALIVCAVTQSAGLAELFQARCPESEIVYF